MSLVNITDFILQHHNISGPVLFLLMVMESAPLIGFLVPGTLILPAIGILTGHDINSFLYMYTYAVAGACIGDLLGYWLGCRGGRVWQPQLLKSHHSHSLQLADDMLKRHGAIAVFLGRFVWLIHPAVPTAAGLFGVPLRKFLWLDFSAAALWVLLYMGAGHIITGIWMHQTQQALPILSLILAVVLIMYLLHLFISRLSHRQ